jgi:hypothetical protein
MQWGRSPYISTFPYAHGKIFLMGGMRKIQKHKEERDRSGKFKKNKKERMKEIKRKDLCVHGISHTCVFSIGWGCPQATALVGRSLRRTHSYGNLPYNITRLEKKHCSSCPNIARPVPICIV